MSINNVETVSVTIAPSLATALRTLARGDKKRNASQLAEALLVQSVKGRMNQKREKANETYSQKWDDAAQIMGVDKMPMPKADYIKRSVAEIDEILSGLATL